MLDSTISAFEKDYWKLFEKTIWVAAPWFLKIGWMLKFKERYDSITDNMLHGVQMGNTVQ